MFQDYVATRLRLREHPVALLKEEIGRVAPASALRTMPDGQSATVTGLVITRQRPGTASGVIFLTLEDDTGVSNVIVWPKIFEKARKEVMAARLLRVCGKVQREGIVTHIIAFRIDDLSYLLDRLGDPISAGATIDPSYETMDEAKRPVQDGRQSRPLKPLLAERITNDLQRAHHAVMSSGTKHPRQQAKKLFPSRDFH